MRRRVFLGAPLLAVGGCKPGTTGPDQGTGLDFTPGETLPWINWAANQGCVPAGRAAPETEDELLALMSRGGAIRPVGSGHSFSALVPTDGTLVATDRLNGVIAVDDAAHTAEVWSGTRLHQLGPALHAQGHALPNLPDINYQTISGATATSTHGAGHNFGSLSSFIRALTIATPAGELIECSADKNADVFHAARCSLGALGIVTRITVSTVPAMFLEERSQFERLPEVLERIDEERANNRNFELYAFPHTDLALVIRTNEIDGPVAAEQETEDPLAAYALRDAYQSIGTLPLVGDFLYNSALGMLGSDVPGIRRGPGHAVLTHDRLLRFREMEYTVPAHAGPQCLVDVLDYIREESVPVVFPIEYRYTKADDIWLSMFHEREGASISVHQFADEDYRPYFDAVEPIFWRYEGRPHWGKLHSLQAGQLKTLYPQWQAFSEVRAALDPAGRMLNPHLRSLLV